MIGLQCLRQFALLAKGRAEEAVGLRHILRACYERMTFLLGLAETSVINQHRDQVQPRRHPVGLRLHAFAINGFRGGELRLSVQGRAEAQARIHVRGCNAQRRTITLFCIAQSLQVALHVAEVVPKGRFVWKALR